MDHYGALDGWQNGDNGRSSWNILWNCMATIFACTWTVLHLGIPLRDTTDRQILLRKVRLLVITTLAPEITTAYAFGEYLAARCLMQQLREAGIAPSTWSLEHAYYFSMGSVNFKLADGTEIPFCVHMDSGDGWEHAVCNPCVVSLIKSKQITMPEISHRQIQDRSKADAFSKLFTLLQSLWFVVNALARCATWLPLSPLEISCLGYIFCTGITYMFWWSKPKDILTTVTFQQNIATSGLSKEIQKAIKDFDPTRSTPCHYRWKLFHLPSTEAEVLNVIRGRLPALVGLLTGVTFCCMHLSAWGFPFPSHAEQLLWRICSVGSAIIPIISLTMPFIRSTSPKKFDASWSFILAFYCVLMLVYVTSRMMIISIMFSSMRSLPARSFLTIDWVTSLPHI